jgi:hypothetical protein
MKTRYLISVAATPLTLLLCMTACASKEIEQQPQQDITSYQRELVDYAIEWQEPGSLKYEILKDYYITDEEFHHAYDVLVECLAAKNITPGWDPSFQTQSFSPDMASQDWYARDSENVDERIAAIQEAQREYDTCDQQSTDTLIEIYQEQIKSTDGRSHYIRMRDALVSCGFSEYADFNEEEMHTEYMKLPIEEGYPHTPCFEQFFLDENTF